ncbi:unnamed protein product, partial [marine sediment metagenome]
LLLTSSFRRLELDYRASSKSKIGDLNNSPIWSYKSLNN